MSRRIEDMTLDEKVDEILKHLRRAHQMAIIKGLISFTLFMVLVVLPLVGFYYWFRDFQENFGMSLEEMSDTLQQVKDVKDLSSIDELRKLLE